MASKNGAEDTENSIKFANSKKEEKSIVGTESIRSIGRSIIIRSINAASAKEESADLEEESSNYQEDYSD